jgi:hypothetical protein
LKIGTIKIKKMKIKIISGKGKWYESRIGKVYQAKYNKEFDCYVLRNYKTLLRTVAKGDAEIIES